MFAPLMVRLSLRKPSVVSLGQRSARLMLLVQGSGPAKRLRNGVSMAKVLMIHPDRCTGCRNCSLACSFRHEGQFRPAASRVHVYSWERKGFSVPMMCQQCDTASCVNVCPTGALHRAKGTTLVEYKRAKCIGCRMCTIACPFGNAVYDSVTEVDPQVRHLRRRSGVRAYCPSQALEFVDDNIATRSRKKVVREQIQECIPRGHDHVRMERHDSARQLDDRSDHRSKRRISRTPPCFSVRAAWATRSTSTRLIRKSIPSRRKTN